MKEKKVYCFPVEIKVNGCAYIVSDSPYKAYKFLEETNLDVLFQFVHDPDNNEIRDVEISEEYVEFEQGDISEEYIIADTEDYEDYDEDL